MGILNISKSGYSRQKLYTNGNEAVRIVKMMVNPFRFISLLNKIYPRYHMLNDKFHRFPSMSPPFFSGFRV